jgi:hypothetical protein
MSDQSRRSGCLNIIPALLTAMIDYHKSESLFLAVLSFIGWPICWIYWLITQSINWSLIKGTFTWFFQ